MLMYTEELLLVAEELRSEVPAGLDPVDGISLCGYRRGQLGILTALDLVV